MIPEDKINEIRNKADIVDIISDYIPVSARGKNFFALCPFHDDHNPSLSISREKQIFNCFTCQTGGNVFNFVKEYENISYPEAIKVVADKVGIDLDYRKSSRSVSKSPFIKTMELAKKYYVNNINTKNGVNAKNYLNSRSINNDTISEFEIGLSTDSKDSLISFLSKQNIKNEELEELGLLSKNGPDIYDTFRNRIMVPIENLEGDTVGFGGRVYETDDLAKYINTKETPIFKKGHIVFNYHKAKTLIKKDQNIIIVEGYFDVIKLSAFGIKNVVALMGTAITKEQISAIKKLRTNITLLLDGDNAGVLAALNVGDELIKNNISCKAVLLPSDNDPDDYITTHGEEKLLKLINDADDFINFKIKILNEKYDTTKIDELSLFIKEILKTVEYLEPLNKDLVLNKLSKDYNIELNILKDRLPKEKKITIKKEPVQSTKIDKYKELANTILYYIANDTKYAKIYKDEVNIFKEKEERELASEIYYYQQENKDYEIADFLTYITNNERLNERVKEILSNNLKEEISNDKFLKYINAMKKILKDDEINILLEKIKKEEDNDKKLKLINKLTKLKKDG